MELGKLMEIVQRVEAEQGPSGRRITAVYHPRHGGQFDGVYGGAPLLDGQPGYRFNDGELVLVDDQAPAA